MNLTLFFFLFLTSAGIADTKKNLTTVEQVKLFRVGEDSFKIKYKNGIGASPQCFEKQGCLALNPETISLFKKVDLKPGIGGANPGAQACHRIPGVEVVIGTNQSSGNQQSFCLFPDKSFISTQSVLALRK